MNASHLNVIREHVARTTNFTHKMLVKPDPNSFYLAGTAGLGHHSIDDNPVGTDVKLIQEPKNPYDKKAVACYLDGVKIGYVPRPLNQFIWHLTDKHYKITRWEPDHTDFPHFQVTLQD